MARHKVTLGIPGFQLGRSDLTLKVAVDGRILGTLMVSKGSLDWRPRGARLTYSATWEDFDRWMQGEERPSLDPPTEPSTPAYSRLVSSDKELLAAAGRSSFTELSEVISEETEYDTFVTSGPDGVEVRVETRGTVLAYPFVLESLWEVAEELDEEVQASETEDGAR